PLLSSLAAVCLFLLGFRKSAFGLTRLESAPLRLAEKSGAGLPGADACVSLSASPKRDPDRSAPPRSGVIFTARGLPLASCASWYGLPSSSTYRPSPDSTRVTGRPTRVATSASAASRTAYHSRMLPGAPAELLAPGSHSLRIQR